MSDNLKNLYHERIQFEPCVYVKCSVHNFKFEVLCYSYMHIRGSSQVGEVPSTYRCYKCHQPGHWIKDCRLGTSQVKHTVSSYCICVFN